MAVQTTGLEITCRKTSQYTYYFIFNLKDKVLPLPEQFIGKTDFLTGKIIEDGKHLKQYDAMLVSVAD